MKQFVYDDGGRASAGYKGDAGDCVTRAITIATGLPYEEVYRSLKTLNLAYMDIRRDKVAKRLRKTGSTPRNGVFKKVYGPYLETLGWKWTPTMFVGQGCKVHLRSDQLPKGRLIVRLSHHVAAVIDGIIHDTHDCSRSGTRCVYGYYQKGEQQ